MGGGRGGFPLLVLLLFVGVRGETLCSCQIDGACSYCSVLLCVGEKGECFIGCGRGRGRVCVLPCVSPRVCVWKGSDLRVQVLGPSLASWAVTRYLIY